MSEAEMPQSPLDKPREEMRVPELRGNIAREVGMKYQWGTSLDKNTLNSLYAFLTGEFFMPKLAMHRPTHREYAYREDILIGIVAEVNIPPREPDEDDEELKRNWTPEAVEVPDKFNREELLTIREAMDERGDQRDWARRG